MHCPRHEKYRVITHFEKIDDCAGIACTGIAEDMVRQLNRCCVRDTVIELEIMLGAIASAPVHTAADMVNNKASRTEWSSLVLAYGIDLHIEVVFLGELSTA